MPLFSFPCQLKRVSWGSLEAGSLNFLMQNLLPTYLISMFSFDPMQNVAILLHIENFSVKQHIFWKPDVKNFTYNMVFESTKEGMCLTRL